MRLSKKITAIGLAAVTLSTFAGLAMANGNVFSVTKAENNNSGYYLKVDSLDDMEDLCGDAGSKYLIVYEVGNVAFNGGLDTLDAVENTVPITISNNKIQNNATLESAQFTIDKIETTILSSSSYYIGWTANSNGLYANTSKKYIHTFSFIDGNFDVVGSGGAHLRYNAAKDQLRFRYYKSATYANQKAIQLYKLWRN